MIRSLAIVACLAAALPAWSQAQAPTRPQIEARKVEGTDNVYIFRNGNHQSIFVVTKEGVIATDPVAYGRPQGGQQYVDEIKKVSKGAPIKYLIYSHRAAPRRASRSWPIRRRRCRTRPSTTRAAPSSSAGYENNRGFVVRRFCGLWGRGT